jgi:murein DD-endopeptidase MepM/ murein hydrolase activator NlpD
MPRLPDYTDLGARPIPRSQRDTARNPHAGAVGEALAGLGEALGEVGRRLPVKPDRAALAAARARLLATDVTLRHELVHEAEHEAWVPRYAERMRAARGEAMAQIANPADRALFAQQADLDESRGAAEIGRAARKARLDADLATLHTTAQAAPDEATRLAAFDTVYEHIAAAQDHGDLAPERAGELRRGWVGNYATQRLDKLLAADNLDEAERFLTAHRDKLDPRGAEQFAAQLSERKQTREHRALAEQARLADSAEGAPDLAARLAHVDAQDLPPERTAAVKQLVIADARREVADLAGQQAEADQAATNVVTDLGDQFTDILMIPAPLRRAMSQGALDQWTAEAAGNKARADGRAEPAGGANTVTDGTKIDYVIEDKSLAEQLEGSENEPSRAAGPLDPNLNRFGEKSPEVPKGFVPLVRDELPEIDDFIEETPEGTEIHQRPDGTQYERLQDGSIREIITVSARDQGYSSSIRAAVKRGATRVGPVPGWRQQAVKGQADSTGRRYADGRYSIDGREMWRTRSDGSGRRHTGIDIPGTLGDPVYAPASGIVLDETDIDGYGVVVLIDHLDGTTTMAAHLDTRLVEPGDRVSIGDVIGTMGNSGNAKGQGTHLHFEAMATNGSLGKRKLDPIKWIDRGRMKN